MTGQTSNRKLLYNAYCKHSYVPCQVPKVKTGDYNNGVIVIICNIDLNYPSIEYIVH